MKSYTEYLLSNRIRVGAVFEWYGYALLSVEYGDSAHAGCFISP